MGNRATIVTKDKDLGVYLHWNGSRVDVEPVLTYCSLHGYRPPEEDGYGWARLCQVFGNYIGGSLSLGVMTYENLPMAMDNGEYVIENWRIVERSIEEDDAFPDDFDMSGALHDIDLRMPLRERLGDYIDSVVVPVEEVELGTTVWLWRGEEHLVQHTVVGFGPKEAREELRGKPYLNYLRMPGEQYWNFGGNYLLDDHVRIKKPSFWPEAVFTEFLGRPLDELR